MDNTPSSSRRLHSQDATVFARLATIEVQLDEIVRRLDDIKNLLALLDDI